MKQVVSISVGSDTRDANATIVLAGETIHVARIGTNGSMVSFAQQLRQWDESADAIGLGGLDRYLFAPGGRRYEFRDVRRLVAANVRRAPVVDGSVVKDSLERRAVLHLAEHNIVNFQGRTTLLVCGVDRPGMADAIADCGGRVLWGDLCFTMGVPYVFRSRAGHARFARWILPVATLLPVSVFYPTGKEQTEITPRWTKLYENADIIAGDFHLIRRYLPEPESGALAGKTILTNTTTEDDVWELTRRKAARLITTTPRFATNNGGTRTFGTNVIEAILTAIHGEPVTADDVLRYADDFGWTPDVRELHTEASPLADAT